MCGITGIYSKFNPDQKNLDNVHSATQSLSNRGPDFSNVFKYNKVALGHTRLSIIDTSSQANQPMHDETNRYTIVYNGEIYNYIELRKELESKGVRFKSTSDTEVVLQLFIFEGEKFLRKLNGFFAFAIYDKDKDKMIMARDRFGIKPLLYYQDNNKLIFASEMKALLQYSIPKKINNTALFTFLQLQYIPAPLSILENVHKLLPGQLIIIENNNITKKQYYTLPFPDQPIRDTYEEAQKKLYSLVDSSVKNRLVSDVPLGAFLSGGIDSSIIVALAAKHLQQLSTFSIGFADHPFFDETAYAKKVADRYNTDHHVFSLKNKDLYDNLFEMLDYIDEPFADSSALPVYILSKLTAKHVKVALSGDGADEIFGGYHKHRGEFLMRNYPFLKLIAPFHPLLKSLPQSRNNHLTNRIRQMTKLSEGAGLSLKERYWLWASITSEKTAKKIFNNFEIPGTYYQTKDYYTKKANLNTSMNAVLYADTHLVLSNDMLRKTDSMSMANSLEVRVPFLDHSVAEYAFQLPDQYKITSKLKKRIVQDTFKDQLPEDIYNRPKKGFEVPLLDWLKGDLKSYWSKELLAPDFIRDQNIFNNDAITEVKMQLHSSNPGDAPARIWALIVFQYWWNKHIK